MSDPAPTESPPSTPELIAKIKAAETSRPVDTTGDAATRMRQELHWEDLALRKDNRGLRKQIAIWVGIGLAAEILFLFWLVASQGMGVALGTHGIYALGRRFVLEQWTFNVFTTSVLVQTFALATLIVRNLFPENHGNDQVKPSSRGAA